jgi:hypothetical protein
MSDHPPTPVDAQSGNPTGTVEDMFIDVLNGRSDISTITYPDDESRVMLGSSSVIELARDLTNALAERTNFDACGETLAFLAKRRDDYHGYTGMGAVVDHDEARRYEILMDVLDPTGMYEGTQEVL